MDKTKGKSNNKYYGIIGEDEACRYLLEKGYEILDRNFKCKFGELDIIALDNKTVVFVEVKTRTSRKYGQAASAITRRKMHSIAFSSYAYLRNRKTLTRRPRRVDIIEVYLGKGWKPESEELGEMEIKHIMNVQVKETESYAI